MKLLDRYIVRSVLLWSFVALLVLSGLLGLETFVKESEDAGTGGFRMVDALFVTLLKMPFFTIQVFPISALLGGLLALGGMARHAELTAMRTAGVSMWRILGSVMMAGGVLAILVIVMSEFVAPISEQRAEVLKAESMDQPSVLRTRHGYWLRDGNLFVNIREVFSGGRIGSVNIYELDDEWQLQRMTWARTGRYRDGEWVLEAVKSARVSPEKVETSWQREWVTPLRLDPEFLDFIAVRPLAMSATDLYQYLQFLAGNEQSRPEYEVALWSKVTVPVTTLILLVLAVAFVLGNPRSVDIGQRIIAGAVTGTVFVMLNRAASFVSLVYDIPPAFSAWIPTLVFLGIALLYLRRLN